MSDSPPSFELRAEPRDGYVYFWQAGVMRDMEELEQVQARIKSALEAAGTRVAMFDNRDTGKPDPMLRAAMWTWLTENVDRAALLQAVPKNVTRADKTAERNRVSYRAFHDEAEAEAWLLGRT